MDRGAIVASLISSTSKKQHGPIPEQASYGLAPDSPPTLKRKRSSTATYNHVSSPRKLQDINLDEPPGSISSVDVTGPFDSASQPKHSISSSQPSRSPPTTPPSQTSSLPLTAENLRKLHQLNGTMSGFQTPKSKKTGTTSHISKSTEDVRQILRINRLFMGDDGAEKAFPEVVKFAEELVEGQRLSPPDPAKVIKIQQTRVANASQNETTFTTKFFHVFVGISRQIHSENVELAVPAGSEDREWAEDGLFDVYNTLYRAGSVPTLASVSKDEGHQALLEGLPKIANPMPDVVYGKEFAQTCRGLAHAFLNVQTKTHGDYEEALNQACTAGAALVRAYRELMKIASLNTHPADGKPYADVATVAFSLVLSAHTAGIYIHWAEVKKDRVNYHMHCAGSYGLGKDKGLNECRAAVKNVLDWGLGERRKAINLLLQKLYNDSKMEGQKAKGKAPVGSDTSPAYKKQRTESRKDDDEA
ncbi:MAG: hypothetical protein Q9182_005794 [Xanthomendoza sp. 2 TL-2023]